MNYVVINLILLNWFKINSTKPNAKKFQFMILGKGSRLQKNHKGITKSNDVRSHDR